MARANIASAGLSHCVEVRVGAALDSLPQLAAEGLGPFDFIFIDADKPNIPEYFDWSVRLARRGSVIVVDNVIREGHIVNANSTDSSVLGVRRFNAALSLDSRVDATTLQTVGSKRYDGFTLAVVVADPWYQRVFVPYEHDETSPHSLVWSVPHGSTGRCGNDRAQRT